MKIANPKQFTDKEIINIIISLHSDHFMFITNWGEFIYGEELNLPPELKNRIFCIWFSGVIDLLIDKEDQFDVLQNECDKRNLVNCIELLIELRYLINSIIKSIIKITREEQILINHHRNTLVHARVYSIHNKKLGFLKYFDSDKTKIEKYNGTNDDFWSLHRKIITGSMDNFLTPLRKKFFNKESDYYKILSVMTNTPFFNRLTQTAYKDLKNNTLH